MPLTVLPAHADLVAAGAAAPGAPSATGTAGSRRTWLVIALVAAAVLLPVSVAALLHPASGLAVDDGGRLAAIIAALVVLHAASLVAHRRPAIALGVGAAAMLALALIPMGGLSGAALLPSAAAYLLITGHAAAHADARLRWAALAIGVAGAGLMTAIDTLRSPTGDALLIVGRLLGLAATVGVAWLVGALERGRRDQVAAREAARVRQAVAAERTRISRDLHDVVAHSLTVMIAQAEAARLLVDADPARSATAIERVATTGREAMQGLRGMLRVLDDGGPATRDPSPGIEGLAGLVAGAASPAHDTAFSERGQRRPLPPDAELALYRAVQESLTNAVRHLEPPVRIRVELVWDETDVVVTIVDDGGRGHAASREGGGTGLIALTERLRSAGGDLAIRRGRGWSVRASLPIEAP